MEIEILKGDITKVRADAIVNAANRTLLGGGGVDGAIHRAAGPELLEECRTLNGCETGKAKITKGYNLPAKYVIHAVGPVWHGGNSNEDELLASCYCTSLEIADNYELTSIAFPAISTGVYGFPIERATKIALNTVLDYFKNRQSSIRKVLFVTFSQRDYEIYKRIFNETNKN